MREVLPVRETIRGRKRERLAVRNTETINETP